jgi:hypothetical protein
VNKKNVFKATACFGCFCFVHEIDVFIDLKQFMMGLANRIGVCSTLHARHYSSATMM